MSAIPDGTYNAEGFLDDDGLGHGPIPVKLRIDIEGDRMTIDLEGRRSRWRPRQLRLRADRVGVPRRFQAADQPRAPGRRRHVQDARGQGAAGLDLRRQEPAACQWYFSSLGLLIDLVVTALSPVLPDKVAAAHFGDSMVAFLAGRDPRRGNARSST